nr:hypothetical protein [Nannocystis sp.]
IFPQPVLIIHHIRSYRKGDLRGPQPRRGRRISWVLAPNISAHTRGLTLTGRF